MTDNSSPVAAVTQPTPATRHATSAAHPHAATLRLHPQRLVRPSSSCNFSRRASSSARPAVDNRRAIMETSP